MDRERIDEYLASVERDMRQAGADEQQIAAVRATLAEHIDEARREAGWNVPVETVLRSIDPPAAFRGSAPDPATKTVVPSWLGALSLGMALGTTLIALVVLPVVSQPLADRVGAPIFVFGEATAAALGYLSRAGAVGRSGLIASIVAVLVFLLAVAVS